MQYINSSTAKGALYPRLAIFVILNYENLDGLLYMKQNDSKACKNLL